MELAYTAVFKTAVLARELWVRAPPPPHHIEIPSTQPVPLGGGPGVRGGIEGASMVKMLFSVIHGANRCTVALTVHCSVKNGAPS